MNKLGISLPWDFLSDTLLTKEALIIKSNMGSPSIFLKILKEEGVTSIELRHRHKDLPYDDMYKAVEIAKAFEFALNIHGEALPEPSFFDFTGLFPWYKIVNELYRDNKNTITVTFHPLIKDKDKKLSAKITVEILKKLITFNELPSCTYALENQRSKGYIDPGITFKGIVDMVSKIPDKKIGICWDMGHSYSNVINYNHTLFPPKEFLERVTHTHIHDLGPAGRTHWPFKENEVPLEKNIKLLQSYDYKGVYNLELSFDRFAEEPDIYSLVTGTIKKMRKLTGL